MKLNKKVKILLIVGVVLVLGLVALKCARAETLSIGDSLKKIPALKQGVAFSLIENDFSYLSTVELMNWKGLTLEAGYSSKDKAVGVISYQLLKLKDLGVKVPVLDLVGFNVGVYGGFGRIAIGPGNAKDNNEWDTGVSLTLFNIKW